MHYQYLTDVQQITKDTPKEKIASRLYFHPEDFDTPFKSVCERDSQSAEYLSVDSFLYETAINNANVCYFTLIQLQNAMARKCVKIDAKALKELIGDNENITFVGNTRQLSIEGLTTKGRYYSYTVKEEAEEAEEIETEETDNLPF